MYKVLLTGAAGFIGFHASKLLLEKGHYVYGIDSLSKYYDIKLKNNRLKILSKYKNFDFKKVSLENSNQIKNIFNKNNFNIIIHLAAQAGVRYSLKNPSSYIESNIIGTFNLLEQIKYNQVKHALFASTSSVYGANLSMPFRETQKADNQISIYAATKKATENLAHSYSHSFKIPITMMRFFTVYGPWGRPDMALFKFTKNILDAKPIEVYNYGKMKRDFTYIDDVSNAIYRLIPKSPANVSINKFDNISRVAPFRIINIGNSQLVNLNDFIKAIENTLGKKAIIKYVDMQMGDVKKTLSNTNVLAKITSFRPKTSYKKGIKEFIKWYREYYQI